MMMSSSLSIVIGQTACAFTADRGRGYVIAYICAYFQWTGLNVPEHTFTPHSSSVLSAITVAATRSDWQLVNNVDVLLRQRPLSKTITKSQHHCLILSTPTMRAKALVLFTSLTHACDWLNVEPSPSLGLHLLDCKYRFYLRYQIGVSLVPKPHPQNRERVWGFSTDFFVALNKQSHNAVHVQCELIDRTSEIQTSLYALLEL